MIGRDLTTLELIQLHELIEKHERTIDQQQASIDKLTIERDYWHNATQAALLQQDDLKAEIERLKSESAEMDEENTRLITENASLREELAGLQKGCDNLHEHINHYRAVIDSAPHDKKCVNRQFHKSWNAQKCSCWKAKVDE